MVLKMEPWKKRFLYPFHPWDERYIYLHEKNIKINHPWESVNIPITRPNGTSYAWVKTDKPPGPPVVSWFGEFPPPMNGHLSSGGECPKGRLRPYLSHHHLDWKAEAIDERLEPGDFPWELLVWLNPRNSQ